jgi:nucleotide-binding universal stress UspA family protein
VQQELAYWRDEAQSVAARPVSVLEAHGEPAQEILRLAQVHGADAIVVGTHGRRGLERMVLGSVAEQVTRQARCAVVVVHPASAAVRKAKTEAGAHAEP